MSALRPCLYLARSLTKADHPPTDQQLEVFEELEAELSRATASVFAELRDVEIPAFNEHRREQGIENVILAPL